MKNSGVWGNINGVAFFFILFLLVILEFGTQMIEKGVGHYLKWQNHLRPQLGRIWEKDRQNIMAQKKIESILASLNIQERSAESIQSFKDLFEQLNPSFPQLISRKKFLELYYEYPGAWSHKIVSPYDLVEIDSHKNWRRVLLTRFGPWITMSFIDSQNLPIREIFISYESVEPIQSTQTIQKGTLEENNFRKEWIFTLQNYLLMLKKLDPETRSELLPDPKWFLSKRYFISRVGIKEDRSENKFPPPYVLGVEYESEFFSDVLILPVPPEMATNLLSQMEMAYSHSENPSNSPFQEF